MFSAGKEQHASVIMWRWGGVEVSFVGGAVTKEQIYGSGAASKSHIIVNQLTSDFAPFHLFSTVSFSFVHLSICQKL